MTKWYKNCYFNSKYMNGRINVWINSNKRENATFLFSLEITKKNFELNENLFSTFIISGEQFFSVFDFIHSEKENQMCMDRKSRNQLYL